MSNQDSNSTTEYAVKVHPASDRPEWWWQITANGRYWKGDYAATQSDALATAASALRDAK